MVLNEETHPEFQDLFSHKRSLPSTECFGRVDVSVQELPVSFLSCFVDVTSATPPRHHSITSTIIVETHSTIGPHRTSANFLKRPGHTCNLRMFVQPNAMGSQRSNGDRNCHRSHTHTAPAPPSDPYSPDSATSDPCQRSPSPTN